LSDIFKNKFFIIALIVICALTLSTVVLNLAGYGSVVSDVTNAVLSPFKYFADVSRESFAGFAAYFSEFNRMKDEIEELKTKLAAAEALNEDTRILRERNDMLMSFYELKRERMDYDLQPAKVIATDPGNYLLSLTINKGAFHDIEKDMPVIAAVGTEYVIIGYVGETGLTSSKVVPFIKAGESVGAYIKRTDEPGIIEGDFTLERNGLCRVAYLPKDALIEPGDKIYTSGTGGIYPENLYIGEVISVGADPFSQTPTGHVRPAADFSEIKDVMVVLKFEKRFN